METCTSYRRIIVTQRTFTSKNEPFPYIYIENIFTEKELEKIHQELDYYQMMKNDFFLNAKDTAPAQSKDGKILKKNKAFFLTEVWSSPNFSYICKTCHSLFVPNAFSHEDNHYFKGFRPGLTGFLISYYGDGDYYKPHSDSAVASMVIWIYKEPKKFEGGDFIFSDFPDLKVESKNNCGIIFPSRYWHQVNPVKISVEDQEAGNGRYSFNLFMDNYVQPPQ